MDTVLLVIALVATGAILGAGLYFTFRGFSAANRPADVTPAHMKNNPHDAATTAQLKHFFEGKECAECGRSIPPVHAFERRPGLLNAKTREAMAWDDIPSSELSATLETHLPICASCAIDETFRQQHPELVVDRHRPMEHSPH